jgi:hypothetical protein
MEKTFQIAEQNQREKTISQKAMRMSTAKTERKQDATQFEQKSRNMANEIKTLSAQASLPTL